uniref:RING-type domain-containing protein n=1 Tax=Psilocybe cubensis TaxID=181762 RepID=A0A8H7XXD4_PSICU
MLTLAPGCACDVCAEEYGPHRLPHSIPCGHVLCAPCCTTIVEKTAARLSPACPFCREHFTADAMRLIRMDFTTSGWSTPRRFPAMETLTDSLMTSEMLQRKTAHLMSSGKGRIEVRRLEEKVARIAAKKCSVEEVSGLYKELEEWLLAEKDDQTSSLFLSAALLRAILMNHLAHSDASKAAKTTEANLKHKVDDLEQQSNRLDAEVRKYRSQYNQKSQECQQLRTEVQQLRALATTLGVTPPEFPSVPTSPTPSPAPYATSSASSSAASSATSTPATSPPTSPPTSPTPGGRYTSMHTRSASLSSRPTTPGIGLMHSLSHGPTSPTRSHTPAVRSHTPGPPPSTSSGAAGLDRDGSVRRPYTPGPGPSTASAAAEAHKLMRSQTPLPPRSHTPAPAATMRSQTPGPDKHYTSASQYAQQQAAAAAAAPPVPSIPSRFTTGLGSAGAGAPLPPPKPRRLSTPSPPAAKMMSRSTSDDKYGYHSTAHHAHAPSHSISANNNINTYHGQQHQVWMPPVPVSADDDYVIRNSERDAGRDYAKEARDKERYGASLARSSTARPASRAGGFVGGLFKR